MARLRRNFVPGRVHHAISRVHSGEFRIQDQRERNEFLRRLGRTLQKTDWLLLAYAVMSNHIHLVLLAGLLPPALLFQSLNGGFAGWLNHRQGRIGALFAGRYRLWAVRRPTADLIAYVHNNPVRAGVVPTAADSTWTSHYDYLRPETRPAWLAVAAGMERSRFDCPNAFDQYVRLRQNEPRDPIWQGERDAQVLDDVHEVGGCAVEVAEPVIADPSVYGLLMRPGGFADVRHDYNPEQIIDAVAHVVGIPAQMFRGRSKSRDITRAKRLALKAWRSMRGPQAAMCAALGMSPSAACGLLDSNANRHRAEDDERVWQTLLERYPQKI